MPNFNLGDYVDVQTRIARFWTQHPDGAIRTALASPPDDWERCRYRAEVYKDASNAYPDAVGYAFEVAGGRGPNATSHEENCETSAIGRALANMGYATSGKDRPSRQEMQKASASGNVPQRPPAAPPRDAIPQQAADIVQPDTDWQRANKRLHAVAKQYGIAHESLSEWADHKHRVGSLTELPAKVLDDLATALDDKTGSSAETFLRKYAPVGVAQGQLVDAPAAVDVTRLGQ